MRAATYASPPDSDCTLAAAGWEGEFRDRASLERFGPSEPCLSSDAVDVHDFGELQARPERPGMAGGSQLHTRDLIVGEWSLRAAAWTDRHQHEEVNYVLEGELHVECDGVMRVVRPGEAVLVPAGSVARYAAPVFARMLYIYGPSPDGRHGATDTRYEALPVAEEPS